MGELTAEKYRELFKLRAEGKLDDMECTKKLYEILKPIYFKGMSILDVPCGVGHYYRKLKELGEINYIGIDLDSEAIEMAKDVWKDDKNVKFSVGNASGLDLEDKSIDVVCCYNLLLHLPDYKEPVQELFRVSKKYIIIRSLFDEKNFINKFNAAEDYREVYKEGVFYYNTYARKNVEEFVKSFGPCKVKFVPDNIKIPEENLRKQEEALNIDSGEFARGEADKKQDWKGLKLNYEILFIEKEGRNHD